MKFSTEILVQVAEMLFEDWTRQGLDLQTMTAGEVERQLQEGLQDAGRLVLQKLWEAQDEALHAAGVTCEHADCQGKAMKRVSRREVQVTSIWGAVKYRRGEYVCEQGHRKSALDQQQGLHPGQPTPHLEMLLGLSGAAMPFEQGKAWVQGCKSTSVRTRFDGRPIPWENGRQSKRKPGMPKAEARKGNANG